MDMLNVEPEDDDDEQLPPFTEFDPLTLGFGLEDEPDNQPTKEETASTVVDVPGSSYSGLVAEEVEEESSAAVSSQFCSGCDQMVPLEDYVSQSQSDDARGEVSRIPESQC